MSGSDPLGWLGSAIEDRFTVEEVEGEGGFGIVYRGRHLGFDEPVAIKCLKIPAQLSNEQREKFMREFQAEARLLHRLSRKTAAIVQALDVGAAMSPKGIWTPFIVMEWLEGHTVEEDIANRVRKGLPQPNIAEAIELLASAAEGLGVAHESGIAHLDVKPANLFLTEDEGRITVKVLDFGIARTFRSNNTLTRAMTAQGTALQAFTPDYASPEQFHKRHGKPGAHTDVFALGLILIELASGQRALDGDTPLQLYISAANEQIRPSLSANGVDVSDNLEAAVRRALEVDPQKRYPDAGTMWHALLDALAEAPESQHPRSPVMISLSPPSVSGEPGAATAATAFASATMGQNRVCTVLFAELLGTEMLAQQLDPELMRQVIERCLDVVANCVAAAGGTVEELVGDRLMAVFGLHSDSAGAAERAVHAALSMRRALANFAIPHRALRSLRLRVRAGINTGRVFVALSTGSRTTGRLSLTGAPVTLAAKLQQAAGPDEILVGRDTYRQITGLFDSELLALSTTHDTGRTLKIYRVHDVASASAGLDATVERVFHGIATRFFDRQSEMETLGLIAEGVRRQSRARSVTLRGPAGIGRSRLLLEHAQQLEESGFAVLALACSSLHTRTSYALAAGLLRAFFKVHEDDTRDVAHTKLRGGIEMLRERSRQRARREPQPRAPWSGSRRLSAINDEEVIAQLLWVLGHRASPESADELGTNDRTLPIKHRIAGAFAAMLGAAGGPLALLCDDAQWADDASIELLDDLLVRMADQPLLVVCAAQPVLGDRHPAWLQSGPTRDTVELGPLPSHYLEQMIQDRLSRVNELPPELVQRVAELSEGYPLTMVEILHLLIDAGAIEVESDNSWKVHSERVGTLALPTSILGIVQARLDRLDEWSRTLLAKAAIVGRTFWDDVLRELDSQAAQKSEAFAKALSTLCERGIVRKSPSSMFAGTQEYSFAESATQQVAYDMLPSASKRDLHNAVATWIEARSNVDDAAPLVARHYERAGMLDRAARAYARAAARNASLGQNAEALLGYERACRLDDWMSGELEPDSPTEEIFIGWEEPSQATPMSWPERVRLRVELGDVLRRMGNLDDAERRYSEARRRIQRNTEDASDPLDVARWKSRIDFRLSILADVRGDVSGGRHLVERAIHRAQLCAMGAELAQMMAHLAALHLRELDTQACRDASLKGLRVLRTVAKRSARWRDAASWLLRTLGGAFYTRGELVRAERCYLQASRFFDAQENPYEVARALNNVAAARFACANLEGARDSFRASLELADRSGDLWTSMTVLANLGEVEHALGRHELARDLLQEAVELGERIGARGDLADCYRNLGDASAALGLYEDAVKALIQALELAKTGGGRMYLSAVTATAERVVQRAAEAGANVGLLEQALAEVRATQELA